MKKMNCYLTLIISLFLSFGVRAQNWLLIHQDDTSYFTSMADSLAEVIYTVDHIDASGTYPVWHMKQSVVPAYELYGTPGIDTTKGVYYDSSYHWLGEKLVEMGNGDWISQKYGRSNLIRTSVPHNERWLYEAIKNDSAWISWTGIINVMNTNDSVIIIQSDLGDSAVISKEHGLISYTSPETNQKKTFRVIGSEKHAFGLNMPGFHEIYAYQPGDIVCSAYSNDQGTFSSEKYQFQARLEIKQVNRYPDSIEIIAERYWKQRHFDSWTGEEITSGVEPNFTLTIVRSQTQVNLPANIYLPKSHPTGAITIHHFPLHTRFDSKRMISRLLYKDGQTILYSGEGWYNPFPHVAYLRGPGPSGILRQGDMQDEDLSLTSIKGLGETYMHWKILYWSEYYGLTSYIRNGDTLIGIPWERSQLNEVPDKPKPIKAVLYPNPGEGKINIIMESPEVLNYEVFSMTGQIVAKGTLNPENMKIDLSDEAAGIYTVQLRSEKGSVQLKYVRE